MPKKLRWWAMAIVVAVAVIGASWYWQHRRSALLGADRSTPARIILAENQFPQSALTIIAYRKGFFRNRGLDVEVRRFSSGKLALDAVLGGGANFATTAETPIVYAGFANLHARIVATISYSSDSCKVAARKDLGILKPSDLKGRKVATAIGTSAEFFMEAFLRGNGLSRSDVQVVTLKPEDMPGALNRGDIAAFFVWEPYIYLAEKLLGERLQVFSGERFYTETFNLATTEPYARENARIVKSVLYALIDAEDYIRTHPDEAIATVADRIGIDPTVLKKIWPAYHEGVVLDESLIQEMQEEGDWALRSQRVNATTSIPDFRSMVDPGPLREINPAVVKIR